MVVLRIAGSKLSLLKLFLDQNLIPPFYNLLRFFCFLMLQTTMSAILWIMDANKDVSIRLGVFFCACLVGYQLNSDNKTCSGEIEKTETICKNSKLIKPLAEQWYENGWYYCNKIIFCCWVSPFTHCFKVARLVNLNIVFTD